MTLRPSHLACAQYAVIAWMMLGSWHALLTPYTGAARTLRVLFNPDFALRNYFIGSAGVTLISLLLTLAYCTPLAQRRLVAAGLFVLGVAVLAASLRLFDVTMALISASGCALALWAWRMPQAAVLGDTAEQPPGETAAQTAAAREQGGPPAD